VFERGRGVNSTKYDGGGHCMVFGLVVSRSVRERGRGEEG
jgi:hypothetical protein